MLNAIENVKWSNAIGFLIQIGIFTIVYAAGLTGLVFLRKRRLFLSKKLASDDSKSASRPAMNTYELENALFGYLHKQKRLEAPVGAICILVVNITIAIAYGLIIYRGVSLSDVILGVVFILFFGALGLYGFLINLKTFR